MNIGDRVKIAKNVQVRWDGSALALRDMDGYPIAELILLDQQHQFPSDDFSEEDMDKAAKFIGAE